MEGAMWKAMCMEQERAAGPSSTSGHARRASGLRDGQQFQARAALGAFAAPTAPLSLQRRHFGQCVARKPAKGAASDRRPSGTPTIHDIWVEECGSFCRAADLVLCRPSG